MREWLHAIKAHAEAAVIDLEKRAMYHAAVRGVMNGAVTRLTNPSEATEDEIKAAVKATIEVFNSLE